MPGTSTLVTLLLIPRQDRDPREPLVKKGSSSHPAFLLRTSQSPRRFHCMGRQWSITSINRWATSGPLSGPILEGQMIRICPAHPLALEIWDSLQRRNSWRSSPQVFQRCERCKLGFQRIESWMARWVLLGVGDTTDIIGWSCLQYRGSRHCKARLLSSLTSTALSRSSTRHSCKVPM